MFGCCSFGAVDRVGDGSREVLGDAASDEEAEARVPVLIFLNFGCGGGEGDLWVREDIDGIEASPTLCCSFTSFAESAVVASSACDPASAICCCAVQGEARRAIVGCE